MSKPPVFHTPAGAVKRPLLHLGALTEDEMLRLMRAFTTGKTEVLDDDAMVLVQWAHAQRMGAMVLDMILAGEVVPSIHAGQVCVALPGCPQEENLYAP